MSTSDNRTINPKRSQNNEIHETQGKEVASVESRQKRAYFTCPECRGHYLDQWIVGLDIHCDIVGVTQQGCLFDDHDTEVCGGFAPISYCCRDCGFEVPYEEDEDFDDADDEYVVSKWIFQNCGQYVGEDLNEPREDPQAATILKFSCPHCRGRKLMVVRLGTCEVTPVQYATDDGQLWCGKMWYDSGEHYFECSACHSKLVPNVDDPNRIGQALALWIIENCPQD